MRTLVKFLVLGVSFNLTAAEFEVFSVGNSVVDESTATVFYVDRGDQALLAINQRMLAAGVSSEEQGKAYATPELQHALVNQINGLVKAGRYQLKYFPAVVIDGRYVIYGTTDISLYDEMRP